MHSISDAFAPLGVSWRDHVPNSTILYLTGSHDLITTMRQRRLFWLGHVHFMEDGLLPKHRSTGVQIFGDAKNFCPNLILFFPNNV